MIQTAQGKLLKRVDFWLVITVYLIIYIYMISN